MEITENHESVFMGFFMEINVGRFFRCPGAIEERGVLRVAIELSSPLWAQNNKSRRYYSKETLL